MYRVEMDVILRFGGQLILSEQIFDIFVGRQWISPGQIEEPLFGLPQFYRWP